MQDLAGIAGGEERCAKVDEFVGLKPGLLRELAFAADQVVFAAFKLSSRSFENHLGKGITELAHHIAQTVFVHRQNTDTARMLDNLALDDAAIY